MFTDPRQPVGSVLFLKFRHLCSELEWCGMRLGVGKEGLELEKVLEEIERACVIQFWMSQTM